MEITSGELIAIMRTGFLLLVIFVSFIFWCKIPAHKSPFFRALGLLVGLAFLTEIAGLITAIIDFPNSSIYNLFTTLQALITCYLLYLLHPKWRFVWMLMALISVVLMALPGFKLANGIQLLKIESILVIFLMLSLFCLLVLIRLALFADMALYRMPEFWVVMGLLVYFGGMSPYLSVMRHLIDVDHDLVSKLRNIIIPSVVSFHYVLIMIGCTLERKKS